MIRYNHIIFELIRLFLHRDHAFSFRRRSSGLRLGLSRPNYFITVVNNAFVLADNMLSEVFSVLFPSAQFALVGVVKASIFDPRSDFAFFFEPALVSSVSLQFLRSARVKFDQV